MPRSRARCSDWIEGGLDAEALAALGSSCVEHLPPTPGGHPRAEAVRPLALQIARLKGSLHGLFRLVISPRLRLFWKRLRALAQSRRDFMEAL